MEGASKEALHNDHPSTSPTRPKALIAEDQQMMRYLLRHLLEELGCTVVSEAANGREAVEMARILKPDFLITDIEMPLLDGLEAVRLILTQRKIPVIVCSAYATSYMVARATDLGVSAFVPKPFRIGQIEAALRHAGIGAPLSAGAASILIL